MIENIQRDLNIALVNELSLIFERLGIDVYDVLEAAGTKWNFHKYKPGLVGGHCIPVDPYYLVHKARETGYEPKIILAGREINNYMPVHVAKLAEEELKKTGKKNPDTLLLGLTFKKNVKDIRNTSAKALIEEFRKRGYTVHAFDPVAKTEDAAGFGIDIAKSLDDLKDIDCIVMVTDHDAFSGITLERLKNISSDNPVLIDSRGFFDPQKAREAGFAFRRL